MPVDAKEGDFFFLFVPSHDLPPNKEVGESRRSNIFAGVKLGN